MVYFVLYRKLNVCFGLLVRQNETFEVVTFDSEKLFSDILGPLKGSQENCEGSADNSPDRHNNVHYFPDLNAFVCFI